MRPPGAGRTLAFLFAGALVVVSGAIITLWTLAEDRLTGWAGVLLLAVLLALWATAWAFARSTARANAALGAQALTLQQRLDQAAARLDELTKAHGRFVGNVAHEIKTPLSTVLSQADLLLAGNADPTTVQRYARSIGDEMRHLSGLVDSFLRLARPFAQEDTTQHVPVHFHDVVVDAVRRTKSLASEGAVSIVATLAEPASGEPEPEVLGDPILLEAMVENLLRNAVRFSPRGAKIDLSVEMQEESLLLRVRDHGTGVAPAHLEAVFDWFFAPSSERRSSGIGFGLAIARRVAEHHRGAIALRNCPDGGCEFEVRLPRCAAGITPADGDPDGRPDAAG